jgi:hypothetical protein
MNEIRTDRAGARRPRTLALVRRGLAFAAALALAACLAVATAGAEAAKPKPAIAGVTLDGKRLSLTSLRGKPVLINVWSSW